MDRPPSPRLYKQGWWTDTHLGREFVPQEAELPVELSEGVGLAGVGGFVIIRLGVAHDVGLELPLRLVQERSLLLQRHLPCLHRRQGSTGCRGGQGTRQPQTSYVLKVRVVALSFRGAASIDFRVGVSIEF